MKICGLTREQDVRAVNASAPDLCGFVVDVPHSRRNVSAQRVRALAALVAPGIVRVGVFVDADPALMAALVAAGALDAVQLHGHESPGDVRRAKAACGCPVIQAVGIAGPADVARAQESPADLVLVDHVGGGTGEAFAWELLAGLGRPLMLAGGLGPDNALAALGAVRPWGVDMSSGVETGGVKDARKIEAAVAAVRSFG